ncbi:MAG: addiction module antidote protein [Pseudomonas sp.]
MIIQSFDVSAHLDDEETIRAYLSAALEDPNPDAFLLALGNVAKARGMTQLAEAAGVGRQSLYKALVPGAHPRYDTVLKLISALGLKLAVQGTRAA